MKSLYVFGFIVAFSLQLVRSEILPDPTTVIFQSSNAIYGANTLCIENKNEKYQFAGQSFRMKETYYLQNFSDSNYKALYQLTFFAVGGSNKLNETTYLKNEDGFWDVYPNLAVSMSNLYNISATVDPFRHVCAATTNTYRLQINQVTRERGPAYQIIGESLTPQVLSKIDPTNGFVPVKFEYIVDASSYLPLELHQTVQNGLKVDKVFQNIAINRKFDPDLFTLGDRKRAHPSGFSEYAQLKLEGLSAFNKSLVNANAKELIASAAPKPERRLVVIALMLFAVLVPAAILILSTIRKRRNA